MTTCNHYYYCKCVVLFLITSIFSFMFIILLVATATLDGLPPSQMVLNCFQLLWLYLLYHLLGWLCRLLSWFYFALTCITFNLYILLCFCIQHCVPFPLYGIRATLFWPVIVLLCSLSLRLCLLETLVLRCCVPFLPSLAPPYYYYYYYYYYFTGFGTLLYVHKH